jgi:hypothetical protein
MEMVLGMTRRTAELHQFLPSSSYFNFATDKFIFEPGPKLFGDLLDKVKIPLNISTNKCSGIAEQKISYKV